MRTVLRHSLRWGRQLSRQPLVLAQGVSSAYGIIGTIAAANVLSTRGFSQFAVLTLVQGVAVGLTRGLVGDPCLILRRRHPDALPRLVHIAGALFITVPAMYVVTLTIVGLTQSQSLLIATSTALPIMYDWSRSRAISVNQFSSVLAAELIRMAIVLGIATLAVTRQIQPTGIGLQALLLSAAAPAAALPLMRKAARRRSQTKYKEYADVAKWMVIEFGISQLHTTGPLLLVSAGSLGSTVGAFRLAQTLMGPVNLVFSAFATNFMAVSATSTQNDLRVIANGKRMARKITIFSVAAVVLAMFFCLTFPSVFRAVPTASLLGAIACVGAWTCTGASAGIHTVVLRVLFYQRLITRIRFINVVVTWCGFAAGYLMFGVAGSLAVGFLTASVANPLLTNITAARSYRAHVLPDDLSTQVPSDLRRATTKADP